MDIALIAIGILSVFVAFVIMFEESLRVKDRYLGGFLFLALGLLCFCIPIAIVMCDWKVVEISRTTSSNVEVRTEVISPEETVKTYVNAYTCKVHVEEFYRLMIMFGHNETFKFPEKCDSLSQVSLDQINVYLNELNSDVRFDR